MDRVWNVTTGCTVISEGCRLCYAERATAAVDFAPQVVESELTAPRRWRKPSLVFVSPMGDLFHDEIPVEFIERVFSEMVRAKKHRFGLLTKRPERMAALAPRLPWPENVWAGVTIEKASRLYRLDALYETPAAGRYLSLSPLLGPMPGIPMKGLDMASVGTESGPGARITDPDWVRDIRDQCAAAGVRFAFGGWEGEKRMMVHKHRRRPKSSEGRRRESGKHRELDGVVYPFECIGELPDAT